MTIKETEEQLISEFSMFEDPLEKDSYLIELGKSLPLIHDEYKAETYLISGCQSRVWLHAEYHDGKIIFTADSDALVPKGIISILVRIFSGHSPDEILNADMDFIDKIGLREHLSPTRSNGLSHMIKQMKLYALAFQAREKLSSSGNQ
ncbi:MAG: SufE family protein [Bacteroidota bacterium]|nr:SufE family protein [Bacteroidota bacterium]